MTDQELSDKDVDETKAAAEAVATEAKFEECRRRFLKLDPKLAKMLPTSLVMNTKLLKTFLDDLGFYIEYKQRCANKSLTEWTIFDVGEGRKETKSEAVLRSNVSLAQAPLSGNFFYLRGGDAFRVAMQEGVAGKPNVPFFGSSMWGQAGTVPMVEVYMHADYYEKLKKRTAGRDRALTFVEKPLVDKHGEIPKSPKSRKKKGKKSKKGVRVKVPKAMKKGMKKGMKKKK